MPPTGRFNVRGSYSLTSETLKEFPRQDNAAGVESTRVPCTSLRIVWIEVHADKYG
jgi:hypothetical protein